MAKQKNTTSCFTVKNPLRTLQLSLDFELSPKKNSLAQLTPQSAKVIHLFSDSRPPKSNPVLERLLQEAKRLRW